MNWVFIIIAFVALQRVGEVIYAKRNTARLLQQGAMEVGRAHYPLLVILHTAWLLALLFLVPREQVPNWPLIGVFVLLQVGRLWVISTLGPYWTTRIITLKNAPLVKRGPYRFVRHPNYLIVAGEIAVLPLAFGAWELAIIFSIANAAILTWRIKVENGALMERRL